jgi:hypothetical protein
MLTNHREENEIYPLTSIEIAKAQKKDQEIKIYFKKNAKHQKRICNFNLLKT